MSRYTCKVALVDPRTGTAYDLGGDGAIVLPHLPTPEGVRYDLVVGPEAWVDGEVGPTTTMPKRHALEACYPNPFNPLTTIKYTVPRAGDVSIKIYNVRGELVRALLDEPSPAGRQDLTWDGTDAAGHPVSSGVYFVSVQANGQAQMSKVMLVR